MKSAIVPSIVAVAMLVPGLVSDARAGSLRFDGESAAVMTEDRWIDGPGNGRFALPWGIAEVQESAGLSGSSALAIAPGSAVAWERPSLVAPASGGSATTISTHRLVAFSNENDFRLGTNGTVIGTGDAALTAFSDGTSYFRIEPDGRVLEFASVTDWLDPAHALRDHGITFAGTKVRCAYARPGAYFLQLTASAGSYVGNDIIRFPSVTDLVGGTNGTVIANGASGTIDALHTGSTVYKIDANGVLQSGSGDSIFNITTIGAFHLGTNLSAAFGDGTSLYVQHPWQHTIDPPANTARVRKLSSFHLRLSDPDAAPPVTPAESLRVVLHVGVDGLSALDGNGIGGGTWRLLAPTQSDQFHRISILEDHLAGTYEVHLDAVRIASGLGFKDFNPASSVSFTRIESGSAAWIDHLAETLWLDGPAEDSDGDGADDAAEWTAGTDAADPADVLRLGLHPQAAGPATDLVAFWSSRPGRVYSFEVGSHPGALAPMPQPTIQGDGGPLQQTLRPPIGTDRWFLRLKVAHP